MESKAARPFSNASAFLMASTDSTAQRFGIFSARCLHLFVWRAPMKCQFIVVGRLAAFSRSSIVLNNPSASHTYYGPLPALGIVERIPVSCLANNSPQNACAPSARVSLKHRWRASILILLPIEPVNPPINQPASRLPGMVDASRTDLC